MGVLDVPVWEHRAWGGFTTESENSKWNQMVSGVDQFRISNLNSAFAISSRVHELAEFSILETRFEIGNLAAYIQFAYLLWFTNRRFELDVVEKIRSVNQDVVFKDLNDLSANSVRYGFVNAGLCRLVVQRATCFSNSQ